MSDLIKSFFFDLQRFAEKTFTGGKAEGEEGITLSKLFNSAGRVWQTTDVESLAERTYFWENEDAKVSLSPETDNASTVAGGISLVKGVYDDPTTVAGADGGTKTVYPLKSVEAIDASGLNGGKATFARIDGVTQIVNANGTIDISGDDLGGITFNNGGEKSYDNDLDWNVGTVINLDGEGNIESADAAAGEQITTADGTKVALTNGGTATFVEDTFDAINTFAKDGSVTFDVNEKNVNISGITNESEVIYNFNESGDVIDLTFATADSIAAVNGTGEAQYVVANDISENDNDITIGSTSYKFGDVGENGGVFIVKDNAVTGFLFRDVGDSITVQHGQTEPDLYDQDDSSSSAMSVSKDENRSFSNIKKATLPFKITENDSEYTITKTATGYDVEISGNTTIETDSGATITVSLPKAEGATTAPTAVVSTNEEGQIQSIKDGTTGEDNTGLSGDGAKLNIEGLTPDEMAEGFSINDTEVTPKEDGGNLNLNQETNTDPTTGETTTETKTNADTIDIGEQGYSIEGLEEGDELTYVQDDDGNLKGIKDVPSNASITGGFSGIEINGQSIGVTETASERLGGDGKFIVVGNDAKDGIGKIGALSGIVTVTNAAGASQLVSDGTILINHNGGRIHAMGDTEITFGIDGVSNVTSISDFGDGVAATVEGVLSGLTINGNEVEVVGDGGSRGNGAAEKIVYKTDGNGNDTLVGIDSAGDDVQINKIGGASIVSTYANGTFIFSGGQSFSIAGESDTVIYNAGYDDSGNVTVSAVSGLDGSITSDFADGLEVNGQSIAVDNDGDITVANVEGELQILGLKSDAVLIVADGVKVATATESGDFTFADEQDISISGDSDGVNFQLDGQGHVVGITGLDKGATYSGDVGSISINGQSALGITEEHSDKLDAGDGFFKVAGTSEGIATVSDLAGNVTITDAGGASQLFTNGAIKLDNSAVDDRVITVVGDEAVTFGLEDGTITSINGFDETGTISGDILGLTINGEDLDVTGDGDKEFTYEYDGANYTLGEVDGSSVKVNEKAGANIVETTGDITINFFGEETFTITGEGKAHDEDTEVQFVFDNRDNVTAISGLYGNVTGNFEDGILVNGNAVTVEGDKSVVVYGNDAENAVSAIGDVDAKATVTALGSETKVSTSGAGVYTFVDNGDAETKYTVSGDSDGVTFELDANGKVTGVSDFTSGSLTFEVEGTSSIAINPTVNEEVTFTADGKVTLTVDDEGKLIGIAGASVIDVGSADATIAATEPVTVNGASVAVIDSDKSFNVVLNEDGDIEEINNVTGNATISMDDAYIVTDDDGKFDINGTPYTFSDKDGVIGLTIEDSALTAIDSLDGSVVIDDGRNVELDVNDQEIAITKASSVAAPVTIKAADGKITAVNGLASGDTVEGDLDNAAIDMPGGDTATLTVNDAVYTLYDDADGLIVSGDGTVSDLDENAKLVVGTAGTYKVNGQEIEAQANDTILGYDGGRYAELYDESTILIRGNTDEGLISDRLGLHDYRDSLGGPDYDESSTVVDDPLTKEDTEEIFAEDSEVDLNRPLEIFVTNKGEKETQTLDFGETDFTKKVHLYEGPQDVTLNSEGGNEVIVESVAEGTKNIKLGGGEDDNAYGVGDVVIVDEGKAIGNRVNITGGAGDDSVFVRNNADVIFDMGGSVGGADKLITFASSNARVTLDNYDPASGAGIQIEEPHARDSVGGIAQAIEDGIIEFGDGIVSLKNAEGVAAITFDDNEVVGGTLVNMYTPDGTKQGVGFTHSEGGTVGDAERKDDLILIGNDEGKKKGSSTIIGGIGNDTVFAGEGDSINAGAGNNTIVLQDSASRGGASIALSAGNNVIKNTNNTFYEDHGDTLEVADPSAISYDGTDLIIKGNGFNATVESPSNDSIGADYVNQLVKDSDGKVWKMAIGTGDATIDVKADEDIRADYYKGGALTFENYNGEVAIDLGGDWLKESTIDGTPVVIEGVTTVKAGEGTSTIKGSEANETFYAGKGNTSLYGAGGKNLLVGYDNANNDKEGSTTFFVLGQADTGVNTIQSFAFVSDDNYTNNSITADFIEIDTATNLVREESIEVSGDDVVFSVENRTTGVKETVVVKDAASKSDAPKDMRLSDGVIAQVSKDALVFDKFANFYIATGKNATIKVSDDQDYSKVWLDSVAAAENGANVPNLFEGDIHVIDATGSTVTAELAGNDYNNTILAGDGAASLWGGNFGDDLLIGGNGANTFFYSVGDGQDTIQGAKAGDVIDLADNTLAQLTETVFEGDSLTIKFNDLGSLTVDNVAGVEFKLGGKTYVVNDDRDGYNEKK